MSNETRQYEITRTVSRLLGDSDVVNPFEVREDVEKCLREMRTLAELRILAATMKYRNAVTGDQIREAMQELTLATRPLLDAAFGAPSRVNLRGGR